MSQQTYRGNLSQPNYPFLATKQGRTVIIPNIDQTYVVGMNAEGQFEKQKEVPAAYYMENVVPSDEGYKAIAYRQMIAGVSGFRLLQCIEVPDPDGNIGYIAFGSNNRFYVATKAGSGTYAWNSIGFMPAELLGQISYLTTITSAYINGTFYFYVANIGCYRYDVGTNTIIAQTLSGLVATSVVGICTAFGYMLAYTKDAIAWSSLTNPVDFVPSLITGAGGGNVQEARGRITFAYPIFQGFIIYTSGNIVSASYTGNVRFPFNIRELIGSGGITDRRLLAISETGETHYAFTSVGLQEVTLRAAAITEPTFTDFLAGGIIEDYNATTGTFSARSISAPLDKKLSMCGSRYLVMSYGPRTGSFPIYEYAIVFDLALKRYGKLKITHYDMMHYYFMNNAATEAFESSQLNIAFQLADNSFQVVDLRDNAVGRNGLLMLGKFQGTRNHWIQFISADFENASSTCELDILYSFDGKNTQKEVVSYTQIANGGLLRKLGKITALNYSLVLRGDFDLNTFIMSFWIHGRR